MGWVFDMPDEVYHARSELSSTQLRWFMKSPNYYRHMLQVPMKKSAALDFGHALHLGLLQPDEYPNVVLAAPVCDRRTKEGKLIWENFQKGLKPGTVVLKEDELFAVDRIVRSIRASQWWQDFEKTDLRFEVSGFAELEGIPCRIRVDGLPMVGEVLWDLKSAISVSPGAFKHAVFSHGYVMQAAFYLKVARALGMDKQRFVFLAVEKSGPYDFRPYELEAEVLERAERDIDRALRKFATCKAFDEWPGYHKDEPVRIGLPGWARHDESAPLFGEEDPEE